VCEPNPDRLSGTDWINCNGCCCWLDPGESGIGAADGCELTETCCIGRGR
jgi:hypothetical protein